VKTAKKTSYLTELIERHERWRSEVGGRKEDPDDDRRRRDEYVEPLRRDTAIPDASRRDYEEDPDDMWDFGTVRHTGKTATMGRAGAPPPPIAENGVYSASTTSSRSSTTVVGHNGNGIVHGGSTRGAGESGSADVNKTLPRPSLEGDREIQGTVRRVVAPLADVSLATRTTSTRRRSCRTHIWKTPCSLRCSTRLSCLLLPLCVPFFSSSCKTSRSGFDLVQMFPRVATAEARLALTNLQRAFIEAERMIPGVTDEFVNEIVDSVERVEDEPR
jgi:serine/threonine-protein kinase 24/25/MST4